MEKISLALTSFLIALAMTALKLVVGWFAGSLGILSEAAHSAIDTVAVLMTYLAVRVADKPADREHTYGHGKIESLAALLQTFILLLACFWIVREAMERILFKEAHIRAGWWTFAVMILSIVVDYSRSRMLARAARKFSSQALEADAYHFSVDMFSSALVIVGLILARVGDALGMLGLAKTADALAAIGIVGITLWFSLRLGKRAFDALMDRAPIGILDLVKREVEQMQPVINAHKIRVRRSGPTVFVDLHVCVPRNLSSERSHAIAEEVERHVEEVVPNSEALVHIDPVSTDDESLYDRIRLIARNRAMTIHNLNVYHEKNRVNADLHLEVSNKMNLGQAHAEASKLEKWIRQEMPEISNVNIHIEGRQQEVAEGQDVTDREKHLVDAVKQAAARFPEILNTHNVHVRDIGNQLCVYLHCTFSEASRIADVHDLSTQIEDSLKAQFPHLGRIVIHTEPVAKKSN